MVRVDKKSIEKILFVGRYSVDEEPNSLQPKLPHVYASQNHGVSM